MLIGKLNTKHGVPQCGMINFHGENEAAVSILHRDDKSNHLANGVGSDGSELCPVTLIMLNHTITKSAGRLQTSPTDIAGAVGNVSKCRRASTLRILNERKFQFCFHLTHWDSKASFFFNGHVKWDACWIGMDLGWFGCVCVCVCCPAAWELLRAGSTCPCQNVHRDIIPCNSLLRHGVEKSGWLESWILMNTKHGVPQCGMTNFHGENPGAVSILHGDDKGDMDHSELGSVKVSTSLATVNVHCWDSWQCA